MIPRGRARRSREKPQLTINAVDPPRMQWADDPRRGAMWAAVAFVLAGTIAALASIANAGHYAAHGGSATPVVIAGAAAVGLGLLIPLVPWHRLGPRSTLVLPVIAFAFLVAAEAGSRSSRTPDGAMSTGTIVTLIFVWIGVTQPRWYCAAAAPVAVAGLSFAFRLQGAEISLATVIMTVGIAAVVGELVAWVKRIDRARSDELGVVIEGAGDLRSETDRLAAAGRIAETVVTLLHVPSAAVYLRDGSDRVQLAATAGPMIWASERREIPNGLSVRPVNGGLELAVPLVGRLGQAHGVVVTIGRRRQDEFMLRLAQILGEQAGYRLGDLAAFETLADESRTDALTGVGNRRFADELLAGLRSGDVVAVVDLDDLRGINARHGHYGGDDAIQAVARYLRDAVRESDAVARLGGDEFLVVLRGVGVGAFPLIERIAEDWNLANPDATFSVGAASFDGDDAEAALRAADEALFAAKDNGKALACVALAGTVAPIAQAVGD
jgi:diguanylate cyclase (GGDEF)-like protein